MLAPDQCRDLLGYLAQITDPRRRRGRRHPLVGVLGVAVCAVLAGARSLAAIGEWANDAPGQVLVALGVRRDPWTGAFRPPGEATVRRVLARIDADALDRAIGAWLAGQPPPPPANPSPPTPSRPRRAVAVHGKTLRGSGHHHPPVHLLAVMDHTSRGVLGQAGVDGTPTRSPGSGRCWRAWTSPPPSSPPTPCTPNPTMPTGWSPASTPPMS